ncbi:MAG: methyltransferase domain-containing protein [Butyrivibrio sp.]|nr:methyltransferase domain-containing protein [Butyrivibrio sp.]
MADINYDYYDGNDYYSDGDEVENKILEYIDKHEPEDFEEIFAEDKNLPVFYHLSDTRQSLLNWYDFDGNATVLEIGAGMGALTSFLCDKCKHVVSIELSKRRALAINKRCKSKENLTIMVGDFLKMKFDQKFDYIIAVGVLEHTTVYSNCDNPQLYFLKRLNELLSPGGKLLLAIENRFGIKYWAGEIDDHTGIPFGSINQRHYEKKAKTLDRQSLIDLFNRSGFRKMKFFYPLPDYKYPRVIYSDSYLPDEDIHSCVKPMYYSNYYSYHSIVADEAKLYRPILKNKVFPFFANSFLVEAGDVDCVLSNIDFSAITVEREKDYRQITRLKDGKFEKYATHACGTEHIQNSLANLLEIEKQGLSVIDVSCENGKLIMPYIKDKTLEETLLDLFACGNNTEALRYIDLFWNSILKSSEKIAVHNNRIFAISDLNEYKTIEFGPILKSAYGDMIFSNCFVKNDNLVFYDQEWKFDSLPASFILYTALNVFFSSYPWVNDVFPANKLYEKYGLTTSHMACYTKLAKYLYKDVQNDAVCSVFGILRTIDDNIIDSNIKLLMEGFSQIQSLENSNSQLNSIVHEKDFQIEGKDKVIAEKDFQIEGKDKVIAEKDFQIDGRDKVIAEKDFQIEGKDKVIAEKDFQIEEMNKMITEKIVQLNSKDEEITRRIIEINRMNGNIRRKESEIVRLADENSKLNSELQGIHESVNELEMNSLVWNLFFSASFVRLSFYEKVKKVLTCLFNRKQ